MAVPRRSISRARNRSAIKAANARFQSARTSAPAATPGLDSVMRKASPKQRKQFMKRGVSRKQFRKLSGSSNWRNQRRDSKGRWTK